MKRFFAFLLAAGLVLAVCMPAAAVDVKFSGEWKMEGWYEANRSLGDVGGFGAGFTADGRKWASLGFVNSGLLLTTQFKVAEGLSLTTRARILDKIWGDKMGSSFQVSANGTSPDTQNRPYATERFQRENIEFDQLYLDAVLGPGLLRVGYSSGIFGPAFADTDQPAAGISYAFRGIKDFTIFAAWTRALEQEVRENTGSSNSPASLSNMSDANGDALTLGVIYSKPSWDAGFRYSYTAAHGHSVSGTSTYNPSYTFNLSTLDGYVRGTFGGFFFEAEGLYQFGDYIDTRVGGFYNYYTSANVAVGSVMPAISWNIDAKALYLHGRYTMGPAYFGAKFAYVSGDDPATTGTNESGYLTSGREFKPCLILLNSDRDKFLGALGPGWALGTAIPNLTNITSNNNYTNAYGSGGSSNFYLYQGYVGFKPIAKLDLSASYSYVTLDKKPSFGLTGATATYIDDKVGSEFDLSATYKLYDNLSYMIGFGYLWAGDAWKGTLAGATISNDWLLMHKLTLNF